MSESLAEDERQEPQPPRLRIAKGSPWRIDPGRRAKWSAPAFVSAHAVEVRQIGDPVLHAPAKKPRMDRGELEALAQRLFASMVAARGSASRRRRSAFRSGSRSWTSTRPGSSRSSPRSNG